MTSEGRAAVTRETSPGRGRLFQAAVKTVAIQATYEYPRGWRVVVSWAREDTPKGVWAQERYFDLIPSELCEVISEQLELILQPDRTQWV